MYLCIPNSVSPKSKYLAVYIKLNKKDDLNEELTHNKKRWLFTT